MTEGYARGEMILASAGSGKTYSLTSRMIGLLALGNSPGEILASTFTRKAAGEILERILKRLAEAALHPEGAEELQRATQGWVQAEALTQERCGELLLSIVGQLHTLQVQTLDAFFHSVVHSFALELGLPEGWAIADTSDLERLRSRAVERALIELDPGVVIELVRRVARAVGGREVHALLLREVTALHDIYREIDPSITDPWGIGPNQGAAPDPEQVEGLAVRLEGLDLRNEKGTVHASLQKSVVTSAAALREGRWIDLLKAGIGKSILDGKESYYRWEVSSEAYVLFCEIFVVVARELGRELQNRMSALGRFLPVYDRIFRNLLREEGIQGFSDLTFLLTEGGEDGFLERREEVYYRLDSRVRHILLDEFQDTSNTQWRALAPLVEEILSGGEEGRSVFIVADPKQSIYGWRGGEPRIFGRIRDRFGLEPSALGVSWRSSPDVLGAVNQVFTGIEERATLNTVREIAKRWGEDFTPHLAAPPNQRLRGHVTLEAGPARTGRGRSPFFPLHLDQAAGRVRELHTTIPNATIGVLTQTNRNAEYLVARLRSLGIEASGEGGVPVVDSAPVLAILALLRMADHPGDRISRYLVARTPLGEVVGLGAEAWTDDRRTAEIAAMVRRRLLEEGYGKVLWEWVSALLPELSARDAVRARQLVDLAYRWEDRATLRPADFVRMVEQEKMEDPTATRVRVMTIHRSKGLEFDLVVIPDLDGLSLSGDGRGSFLSLRSEETGGILRIVPYIPAPLRPLFLGDLREVVEALPEINFGDVREAVAQTKERELRDALSSLYVGMTRARYALHMIVEGGTEEQKTPPVTAATLLREAFGVEGGRDEESGEILAALGLSEWWKEAPFQGGLATASQVEPERQHPVALVCTSRRRFLPIQAPSGLEGGGRVSLKDLLPRRDREEGRERARLLGILIHLWLAEIEWLETTGVPDRERLLALARENAPDFTDPEREIDLFLRWVAHAEVQRLLSRESFPEGTKVERELAFIARDGDRLLRGSADRVLRIPDPSGDRLWVIDWKTEAPQEETGGISTLVEYYTPQVRAYLRGLSASRGIPLDRAQGILVFLRTGEVREISGRG